MRSIRAYKELIAMMPKKRELPRYNVQIDYGGKTCRGNYGITGGMVHVRCMYGEKSAMIHGAQREPLAKILLRELVEEWLFAER